MSMSIKELQIYFKIYVKLFPVPQILLDHRAQCMTTAPCEEELYLFMNMLFCYLIYSCWTCYFVFQLLLVFFTLYVYIIIKTIKTIFCVSRFFYFMKKKHVFTIICYSLILNHSFKC